MGAQPVILAAHDVAVASGDLVTLRDDFEVLPSVVAVEGSLGGVSVESVGGGWMIGRKGKKWEEQAFGQFHFGCLFGEDKAVDETRNLISAW